MIKGMPKKKKGETQPPRTERSAEDPEKIALYEEDLYGEEELKEETKQLVVFRLAQEWYGVEITKVKEVIKVERIPYLPSSPEYIAGIVNLRGNILSVTDLKRILGLPQEKLTEKTRIVAIESGILETGLLVNEVAESIEVPVSKIELTLSTIAPEVAGYIEGQCKVNDKLIALLNVEKILETKGVDEESNR
jgi:purine-binding chemotaxis protein CheW